MSTCGQLGGLQLFGNLSLVQFSKLSSLIRYLTFSNTETHSSCVPITPIRKEHKRTISSILALFRSSSLPLPYPQVYRAPHLKIIPTFNLTSYRALCIHTLFFISTRNHTPFPADDILSSRNLESFRCSVFLRTFPDTETNVPNTA